MRVNTDSVLLGSWVESDSAHRVLDIGTGTGLLALMMTQRFPKAMVDAVELDEGACRDADLNFKNSRWSDRLVLHRMDFREWAGQQASQGVYDLIITNPPYFPNGLKSESPTKRVARHQDLLPLDDLLILNSSLLKVGGKLAMILPAAWSVHTEAHFADMGWKILRKLEVSDRPESPVIRVLWELGRHGAHAQYPPPVVEQMSIHTSKINQYTTAYRSLTDTFYLPK